MPLGGGRGLAWRAGEVVLKPADESDAALAWQARVLAHVRPDGVRVARPLPAIGGAFIVDGWCASTFCVGRHEPGRWLEIIEAGRRLHRALTPVARPGFLDSRTDPWAVADRAAWGDIPLGPYRAAPTSAGSSPALLESAPRRR